MVRTRSRLNRCKLDKTHLCICVFVVTQGETANGIYLVIVSNGQIHSNSRMPNLYDCVTYYEDEEKWQSLDTLQVAFFIGQQTLALPCLKGGTMQMRILRVNVTPIGASQAGSRGRGGKRVHKI